MSTTGRKQDRVSAIEAMRKQAHQRLTEAQRDLTASPHDSGARARYGAALQELQAAEDLRQNAPPVKPEFSRAAAEIEELKENAPTLSLKPPTAAPSPLVDQTERGPLVSPYLRDHEAERLRLKEAMLMRRQFQRAARDAFERGR